MSAVPDSDYSSGVTVTHGTTFNITCDAGFSMGTTRATEFSCNDGDLSPDTLPTCYGKNNGLLTVFKDLVSFANARLYLWIKLPLYITAERHTL